MIAATETYSVLRRNGNLLKLLNLFTWAQLQISFTFTAKLWGCTNIARYPYKIHSSTPYIYQHTGCRVLLSITCGYAPRGLYGYLYFCDFSLEDDDTSLKIAINFFRTYDKLPCSVVSETLRYTQTNTHTDAFTLL